MPSLLPRRLLVVIALIVIVSAAQAVVARAQTPDPAMRPEAKAHYDAAMARYRARDYPGAIREFQAAYALDPRREILFAEAQATRLGGDCPRAVTLYQEFLARKPPPQQVDAARIALARCDESVRPKPLPVAPPAPPIVRAMLPEGVGAGGASPYLANGLIAGAGVVAVGVGAALLVSSVSSSGTAGQHPEYDKFAREYSAAESRWRWGLASVVGGSLLVVTGVGRALWFSFGPTVGVRGNF